MLIDNRNYLKKLSTLFQLINKLKNPYIFIYLKFYCSSYGFKIMEYVDFN